MYIDQLRDKKQLDLALELVKAVSGTGINPNDNEFQRFMVDEFVKRDASVAKKIILDIMGGKIRDFNRLKIVHKIFCMIEYTISVFSGTSAYIFDRGFVCDDEIEQKFDLILANMDKIGAEDVYFICAVGMSATICCERTGEEQSKVHKLLDIANNGSPCVWNNRDIPRLRKLADTYYDLGMEYYRTSNIPQYTKRQFKYVKEVQHNLLSGIIGIVNRYEENRGNSALGELKRAMADASNKARQRNENYPH